VFSERGYQATTVGAITERACTAHGTFYLYFKNKEDAFAQVVGDVFDQLYVESETRWAGDGPASGVHDVVARYLSIYVEHKALWRSLLEAVLSNPSIEQTWLAMRRRFVDRMAAGLTRLRAEGRVRPFDPVMSAYVLSGMTEWFAFTHLVLGEPPPGDAAVDEAAAIVADLFVHAVYGQVDGSAP
jgi:AcrR family transcriptional regulator